MDRSSLIAALQAVVGKESVLSGAVDLDMYSYDAGHDRHLPDLVVLPGKTEQIAEIVKLAARAGVPVVAGII
jgi:FAD/FMN-containing dehydrogenase